MNCVTFTIEPLPTQITHSWPCHTSNVLRLLCSMWARNATMALPVHPLTVEVREEPRTLADVPSYLFYAQDDSAKWIIWRDGNAVLLRNVNGDISVISGSPGDYKTSGPSLGHIRDVMMLRSVHEADVAKLKARIAELEPPTKPTTPYVCRVDGRPTEPQIHAGLIDAGKEARLLANKHGRRCDVIDPGTGACVYLAMPDDDCWTLDQLAENRWYVIPYGDDFKFAVIDRGGCVKGSLHDNLFSARRAATKLAKEAAK